MTNMTISQRLTVRASEIRQRLNEIATTDDGELSEEIRAEEAKLSVEYRDCETRLRAAVASEPDPGERHGTEPDAEQRERQELCGKSALGTYLQAALRDRQVSTGPEAELSAAFGCPGLVPLELFSADERREDRDGTPAPATVGQNLATITPALFDRSARLGWESINL